MIGKQENYKSLVSTRHNEGNLPIVFKPGHIVKENRTVTTEISVRRDITTITVRQCLSYN